MDVKYFESVCNTESDFLDVILTDPDLDIPEKCRDFCLNCTFFMTRFVILYAKKMIKYTQNGMKDRFRTYVFQDLEDIYAGKKIEELNALESVDVCDAFKNIPTTTHSPLHTVLLMLAAYKYDCCHFAEIVTHVNVEHIDSDSLLTYLFENSMMSRICILLTKAKKDGCDIYSDYIADFSKSRQQIWVLESMGFGLPSMDYYMTPTDQAKTLAIYREYANGKNRKYRECANGKDRKCRDFKKDNSQYCSIQISQRPEDEQQERYSAEQERYSAEAKQDV